MSAIRIPSRLEGILGQGPVVKFHLASVFGLVSERPVFKTRVIGLNLCPAGLSWRLLSLKNGMI